MRCWKGKHRELNTRQPDKSEMTSSRFGVVDNVPDRLHVARVVNEEHHLERRGPDRRTPSLKSFVYGAFNPRRRRIRRDEDRDSSFIDWYPTHLLVVATLIMCLSVVDGIFTVHLLNAGAVELNPLLDVLVQHDPTSFALVKVFMTAIGVTSLVIVSQARLFRRWPMAWVLYALLFAYAGLVVYGYSLSLVAP